MPFIRFDIQSLQRCRQWLRLFVIFCLLLGVFQAIPQPLPNLGGDEGMSLTAERRLGDRIARELYRDPDWLDDAVLVEYVDEIWQSLRRAARVRGEVTDEMDERMAWRVLLSRDRSINAFAMPGGYFGLHLGLMAMVGSRDELAAVLAHEMSHVTQRHIARMQAQQSRQAPVLLGALILGALAASKNPDATNAVVAGSQAAAAQAQLNYSRDMEREADRIGYGVMVQAGFAPDAMEAVFDKLHRANRLNDRGAFPYLRTHPLTTERLADISMRAPRNETNRPIPSVDGVARHAMMVARARLLSGTSADDAGDHVSASRARDLATQPLARQVAIQYGVALQQMRLRQFEEAAVALGRLDELLQEVGPLSRRTAKLLRAEMLAMQDRWPPLVELLSGDARGAGAFAARPELLAWGHALLRLSGAVPATLVDALQERVALHPDDSSSWQLLSQVLQRQGRALAALRAEAESHAARQDLQAARDRLRAAQDLIRSGAAGRAGADAIDAAIIATRVRELDSRLREQALER